MSDTFKSYTSSLRDPVVSATEVTPNDATDLAQTSRALFVGGAGNLRVTLLNGSEVTFRSVQPGWHPIRVNRVWQTGTSAADIVACA